MKNWKNYLGDKSLKNIVKEKVEGYLEYRRILRHLERVNTTFGRASLPKDIEQQVRLFIDFAPTDTYLQKLRKGKIFAEYCEYKNRDWLYQR